MLAYYAKSLGSFDDAALVRLAMPQMSCTIHVACEVVLETGPAFETAEVVRLMPGTPADVPPFDVQSLNDQFHLDFI